jgi:laccase
MGALGGHAAASACPFLALAVLLALPGLAAGITRHYTFNVRA